MVYTCFLDDSKDQNQSKVMVSAGFFGTKEQWADLRLAWSKILKTHGLDYFKSSEYYKLNGQFSKYRTDAYPKPKGREAASSVRSELQEAMRQRRGIRGVGVAVPLQDYYGIYERDEAKGILPADPYQAALDSVMYETAKIIKAKPGHNMVAFVHDEDDRFSYLYSAYLKFKQANPNIAKYLGGFAPLDDKQHPPLQAADMIANYTMQLDVERLAAGGAKANVKEMRQSIDLLAYWGKHYVLSVLKRNLIKYGKPIPIDISGEEYG